MATPPATDEREARKQRTAARRDLWGCLFGLAVMAVGALLWMRVVIVCERPAAGQPATCVVTQRRVFGLLPFTSWKLEDVRGASHEVFRTTSPTQTRASEPTYILMLETRLGPRPIESGWSGAVQRAQAGLNPLLQSATAGRAQTWIDVWVPGAFALVVGLIPAFLGGQRTLVRRRGGDPDARPRPAKKKRRSG